MSEQPPPPPPTRLRVAVFSEVYWPMVSGVGVTLRRLADSLEARGHLVRVYTPSYHVPEGVEDRREVFRVPSVPFFLYPDVRWGFPRMRNILRDIREFRPDLVHVATEFSMGVTGVKAARALGLPIIASAHTDYEQYATRYYRVGWVQRAGWRYLRWFYGQAETVLCPSRVFERHLNVRGVTNTGIWTRGIDCAVFNPRFRRNEYRRAFGADERDPVVTYVGRIAREKNLLLLLDAWELLGTRRRNAQLVLVGRGPLEHEIRERAVPGVHLAGVKHGEDLSAAYASADLFAFPSTTETFGNVLLEAMASGLPSLVAAAGGVLEFAHHGENSWLVEPDSTEAIIAGLERLLADAPLRNVLGRGALATARERSWANVDADLVADYRRAIAARSLHQAA
ncbi:MAG: glycosyltransferase family 1 protein [Gemmatimonadales bacterium]